MLFQESDFSSLSFLVNSIMAAIDRMNPQNIRGVGISEYIKSPNINAANGSAPERSMEDTPESMYFKLKVEKIYGRAKENVECNIKNNVINSGLRDMKLSIWLKLVNGINAIVINMTE